MNLISWTPKEFDGPASAVLFPAGESTGCPLVWAIIIFNPLIETVMTTTELKNQKSSSHPLHGFTRLFQTEREGVDTALITLGRLALCATFAPKEDPTADEEMWGHALNLYDALLAYREDATP